jgi:hypothetical protein
MSVTLVFKTGVERLFPEATAAVKRGPVMYVTRDNEEGAKFDASEIVSATTILKTGELIIEPEGAWSK